MARSKGLVHLAIRNAQWSRGACSNGRVTGKPVLTDDPAKVTCGVCRITETYAQAVRQERGDGK